MSKTVTSIAPVEVAQNTWRIAPVGNMRVPALIFANRSLVSSLDQKTLQQLINVACLPGIANAAIAMADAHSGYGFPIGGVAGFLPDDGGVISAGGVGYDIACGVRSILTNLTEPELVERKKHLADALFKAIPSGAGTSGSHMLSPKEIDKLLQDGAVWAVNKGMGEPSDLARTEEGGKAEGADPACVSTVAKQRFINQLGTLGTGNHYMEVQVVDEIFNHQTASIFGLKKHQIVISIHCGSRGLGHQIATDYIAQMKQQAIKTGVALPDAELACAPLTSELGKRYLAAMRAGINCSLANRQALTHAVREVFTSFFSHCRLTQLYDVSHNTCKEETHTVNGKNVRLFVHRKGATRAYGPGHPQLHSIFKATGQPILVGGSMGTASWILHGTSDATKSLFSANHGAGRQLSRTQAKKLQHPKPLLAELESAGVLIRTSKLGSLPEEAPFAYKDVDSVIEATCDAKISGKVARLRPLICIKG